MPTLKKARRRRRASQVAHPRLLLRVIFADGVYLGPGKIDLLENVEWHGAIASAAKAMGMSYKRA